MSKLNEIKEKIHTVNPNITDELLDLLYEYIAERVYEVMYNEKNDDSLQEYVTSVALGKISLQVIFSKLLI